MAIFRTKCLALLAVFTGLSIATPSSHSAIKCPITIDGRIPRNTPLSTFDTAASPFDANYTKGQNLTWSQILKYPDVDPSKFDGSSHNKALEVTINDFSIFVSGGTDVQHGFRRAGLLMGNGSDASNEGVKTFHWSMRQDWHARMNLTHEYMNVWHEANDYASNQFSLNVGIMLEQDKPKDGNVSTIGLDKRQWKVLDRRNNVIWTQKIVWDEWQNFAVTVDYEKNTLQIYYSEGYDPLRPVTKPVPNDNSGGGQFQIGILKKPTETTSVVFDGYQESGIFEGQIYGGIFIEDSNRGCVSR
ncbi:Uncharacterized protein BP5553_08354 [Venustampulla echinocandica]|uniref:Glycoside hydrolase 131 catalytic N-terminal domain-containing protein n=1 Tax=Venustampulla echinocandica TaxID=2656787 RepID=A0A370TGF9_9HELO|nr:Uncharacterized protein BP5553_08354 [Venustampulla echinocandica]RDL33986.1 Uncharacterized protein BP5553_08354 [Venustampulla echinocandica]